MKKYLIFLSAMCITWLINTERVAAQDIHFSQFYENAILRNPALTGIFSGDYKAGVNFRNQWGNIATPFVTVLGSYETRFAVNESGDCLSIGLTATYDKAGSIDFTSMQVYPAINYNKALEDKHMSYLSVGFAGGYIQRSVDMSKMTFDNQWVNGSYSSTNPNGEPVSFTKVQYYDLSAGISLNSSIGKNNKINYYIGAAAYHVARPKEAFNSNETFVRLNTKWTGNLGVRAAVDDHIGVTFHLNYTNQNPYQEWIGGVLLNWGTYDDRQQRVFNLSGGCFYRLHDAIIPTIKIDYTTYAFTASYDVNNSTLKPASNGVGGFEFSLFVRGNYKRKQDSRDQNKCPRFENMMPGFMQQ
ncbi:PorP/SprF family type IX secretion system membrane protein [Chitinophagaceae bacterium MMS25-I14]